VRETWFDAFLGLYARLAAASLWPFDHAVRAVGHDIVGRTSLTVAKNCDAMDVQILFAAAVLAFPAPWSRRALGLVGGIALLTFVNVVRIAILYYLQLGSPRAFEWVHAELAPLVLVATAVACFVWWTRAAEPAPERG
jgi:exosortase/archaeosortase family protein